MRAGCWKCSRRRWPSGGPGGLRRCTATLPMRARPRTVTCRDAGPVSAGTLSRPWEKSPRTPTPSTRTAVPASTITSTLPITAYASTTSSPDHRASRRSSTTAPQKATAVWLPSGCQTPRRSTELRNAYELPRPGDRAVRDRRRSRCRGPGGDRRRTGGTGRAGVGQVVGQRGEVAVGPGGVGGLEPLLELVDAEPCPGRPRRAESQPRRVARRRRSAGAIRRRAWRQGSHVETAREGMSAVRVRLRP